MLFDDELKALFQKVKTIAVLGAVDKPGRPVDMVGRYLIEAGFTVLPVHPKRKGVWGLTTYPTLADIDVPVDMVDVFRNADACPGHARETAELLPQPKAFWMQSGITSPEAAQILAPTGIRVIEDACLMVDHRRLAA